MEIEIIFSMIARFKDVEPEKAFIVIGLIFGIIFLIVTPPFQVSDESTHFYKALNLADGHILSEKQGDETGFYIPKSVIEMVGAFKNLPFNNKDKITVGYTGSLMDPPISSNDYKMFVDVSGVVIVSYPPFPYIASASAISLGEFFNFPILMLMYFGRFVNLLMYLILVCIAIRIMPVHKGVLLMLALMPMTIFQGASISADSFTIAISFLITAYIFKLAFDDTEREFNLKDSCILVALFMVLALSKQFYCLLIFLFFMVPTSKFGGWKKKLLKFVYICLPVILIIIFWNFLVAGLYNPIGARSQFLSVLSNPMIFFNSLIITITSKFYYGLLMFVGDLGWLDTPLPQWLIYSYSIILILTSLLDKNDIKINLKQKIIPLVTFALIFVSIFFLEYITWPVTNNIITGVQGRYFIPFAPLLLLLFYNNRIKINGNERSILNWIIILTVFITLLITTFIIIKRYYII
jgi:uncharacterized membrane protein